MADVRLPAMIKHVHLVIQDLFLPADVATKVCGGFHLPALEKILARSGSESVRDSSLEDWLCGTFGIAGQAVAPVTLLADGIKTEGHYWMRADPVNLRILHDQLMLQPAMSVSMDEAEQLCTALNKHFVDEGMYFLAPHPLRWYLRLETDPNLETTLLTKVMGKNVHHYLPQGPDELRWHGILNEIQMLLHAHPVNEAREQRGEWQINGLWLWGGGYAGALNSPLGQMFTDSALASAFAFGAQMPHGPIPDGCDTEWIERCFESGQNMVYVVWNGLGMALEYGDLASWCKSVQQFEQRCAYPLWQLLRAGLIDKITLEVPQEKSPRRYVLTRRGSRKFWRRAHRLADYSPA